jgi:RNA polymerase sigma-70 factor (ECF subfamily)
LRKRPRAAVQPLPDRLWEADPAETRSGVRLAFIVALQHLSPVRRAVLILRDALDWPGAEVAVALGTTTAAVNSALLRARARLAATVPDIHEVPETPSRVLDAYVEAFHDADIAKLVSLFREDIALEVPPRRLITGPAEVAAFLKEQVLTRAGAFQLDRKDANGQPGFAAYQDGLPHALHVLDFRDGRLSRITVFHDIKGLA